MLIIFGNIHINDEVHIMYFTDVSGVTSIPNKYLMTVHSSSLGKKQIYPT